MKKKPKTYGQKYKTVMINQARYLQIIQQAKRAGYNIGKGPQSQLGAWLADASNYYSNARAKNIPLRPAKETKADGRTTKRNSRRTRPGVGDSDAGRKRKPAHSTDKGKTKRPDPRIM